MNTDIQYVEYTRDEESDPQHFARAHKTDAGADLRASEKVMLAPGERETVGTGIRVRIPDGYAAFITPRSGLAANHGITVLNTPGLIDSDYRGELKVILINHSKDYYDVNAGDRIAQLVIQKVERPTFVQVDSLGSTERGSGGLGSTGRA